MFHDWHALLPNGGTSAPLKCFNLLLFVNMHACGGEHSSHCSQSTEFHLPYVVVCLSSLQEVYPCAWVCVNVCVRGGMTLDFKTPRYQEWQISTAQEENIQYIYRFIDASSCYFLFSMNEFHAICQDKWGKQRHHLSHYSNQGRPIFLLWTRLLGMIFMEAHHVAWNCAHLAGDIYYLCIVRPV